MTPETETKIAKLEKNSVFGSALLWMFSVCVIAGLIGLGIQLLFWEPKMSESVTFIMSLFLFFFIFTTARLQGRIRKMEIRILELENEPRNTPAEQK